MSGVSLPAAGIVFIALAVIAIAAIVYPEAPDPYSLIQEYGLNGYGENVPYYSVAKSISRSLVEPGGSKVKGGVEDFIRIHHMMGLPVVEGMPILAKPGVWSDGERLYGHMRVMMLLWRADYIEASGVLVEVDFERYEGPVLVADQLTLVVDGKSYELKYYGQTPMDEDDKPWEDDWEDWEGMHEDMEECMGMRC